MDIDQWINIIDKSRSLEMCSIKLCKVPHIFIDERSFLFQAQSCVYVSSLSTLGDFSCNVTLLTLFQIFITINTSKPR